MENPQSSSKKLYLNANRWLLGFGTSPEADWKIIFFSALILVVVAIALSAFIFIKINKGEIFVVEKPDGQSERTLDLTLLRKTVSYYQGKARVFESVKNKVVPSVDPSL